MNREANQARPEPPEASIARIARALPCLGMCVTLQFPAILQPGQDTPNDLPSTVVSDRFDCDLWVDAEAGDDRGEGTEEAPWATLDHAIASARPGSTIGVRPGSYHLDEATAAGREEYLTLRATPRHQASLDGVHFDYATETDAYLRVEGFEIYSADLGTLVLARNARHVEFIDCDVHASKWARAGSGVDGFRILNCAHFVIERSRVHEVHRGMTISDTSNLTVRRNFIQPTGGSGIQYAGRNKRGVIEFNHILGREYTGYPEDPDAVRDPHASIISVRSGDLVIRGNHLHGMGTSSGVMFYSPDVAGGEAAYSDVLLENNALYDTDNSNALRIYNLGNNFVVRNNLFFSHLRGGDCDGATPDARYRYSTAFAVHSIGDGHNGSGLSLFNNLFIGLINVPDTVVERGNIVWSWGPDPWRTMSPEGGSTIVTNAYGGCGRHSEIFESGFFANPPDWLFPSGAPVDWRLATESPAVNFGAASEQPAESLGSIGKDGFVVDDGPRRSATRRSVGPFEYQVEGR